MRLVVDVQDSVPPDPVAFRHSISSREVKIQGNCIATGMVSAGDRIMVQNGAVHFEPFGETHCEGVVELCRILGWESYTNRETTAAAFTAPGAVSWVAAEDGSVIGLAHLLSDGLVQAHLSLVGVLPTSRRQGIGRRLLRYAFEASGAKWLDLVSEAGAESFYRSFLHTERTGFRIHPTSSTS